MLALVHALLVLDEEDSRQREGRDTGQESRRKARKGGNKGWRLGA